MPRRKNLIILIELLNKLCKKSLNKNLFLHLVIRRLLDKFSNNDLNQFIKYVKDKRVKNIIETKDREKSLAEFYDYVVHDCYDYFKITPR